MMRVAISGTHAAGKSTLVAELRHLLPQYLVVEEPYHELLEEGQLFGAIPTADAIELQLERSCSTLEKERGREVIFDRCPADYLAYLVALKETESVSIWFDRAEAAMMDLDLVVYVPIERPDRIGVSVAEFPRLRKEVDSVLRQMLIEDRWGLEANAITVVGDVAQRVTKVMSRLALMQGAAAG